MKYNIGQVALNCVSLNLKLFLLTHFHLQLAVFVNKDTILHTIDVLGSKEAYDNCTLGGGTIIPINPGKNYTVRSPEFLQSAVSLGLRTIYMLEEGFKTLPYLFIC